MSCVSRDVTARLTSLERKAATSLAGLLENKLVPAERKLRLERAAVWAGKYPGTCTAFHCHLP